jgi:Type II restriction endonuclease EcoO109I
MEILNLREVEKYVEDNIATFHNKRISGLQDLQLKRVLSKKNPYLFKAKYVLTAQDIIKSLTDAFISSQEETIFGDWLEGLAIFVNQKVFGGWKSGIKGIDVEFDKDDVRYIVTIKSGPNWANSSQIAKLISDFKTAKKTLRTSNSRINVIAVNGCCYGKDKQPDKGDYLKYCGQKFWAFMSGDEDFYTKIVDPIGHQARQRNDDFMESYAQMINKFTKQFAETFCRTDGTIDWQRLIIFNSGDED